MEERANSVDEIGQWRDEISLHYEYTAGIAGEKFLRGLMEGRIVGGFCSNCKKTFVPPRIYCVNCFGEISKFVRVRQAGRVAAITEPASGKEGRETNGRLRFAYITFEGVTGGILHLLLGKARVGSSVRPRFRKRSERKGSILDIEGFERRP